MQIIKAKISTLVILCCKIVLFLDLLEAYFYSEETKAYYLKPQRDTQLCQRN